MTLPDTVHNINGFLSPAEAELLYQLATEVPIGGTIVEIGSFQGRSTVCLGLGAKQVPGVEVYAIDPHIDCQVNGETHYGMENYVALLKNLLAFDIADTVRIVALPSIKVIWQITNIDLLWIDGSHEYWDVHFDLFEWAEEVSPTGRIALHDSSGLFPDVEKVLHEFMRGDRWKIAQQIDATTVLERVNV